MSKFYSLAGKRVFLAGHTGLVGQALKRVLSNYDVDLLTPSKAQLDLTSQADLHDYMAENRPDVVLNAAAKVGGIEANRTKPVEFLYENLMMSTQLIRASAEFGVERLMNLASNCYYPRLATQPIKESSLLSGPFEPTNEAYAIAKVAATKLTEYYALQYSLKYFTLVPTSLFGPGDHFDDERGHVIPALMNRFHQAKCQQLSSVTLWGTGAPTREFLYIDDAAQGMLHFVEHYEKPEPVNLCGGEVCSIKVLGETIAHVVGYEGKLEWDSTKPDGMPHKALDSTQCKQSTWLPSTPFLIGLEQTYQSYLKQC